MPTPPAHAPTQVSHGFGGGGELGGKKPPQTHRRRPFDTWLLQFPLDEPEYQ